MTLSVIVVNYNTRDDLRRCLTALMATTLTPFPEIIVVDNASSDGSAAMISAEFPAVRLIEPGENTWFCGGNNLGLAHAKGDYALLLNPDTVPPPNALSALVSFLEAHPDYAGATLRLHYPDERVQRTCSRIPTLQYLLLTQTVLRLLVPPLARRADAHHYYEDEGWARDRDFDVEAMPGSCTCMRRTDLHLDEALRLYFPEDDLARRFAKRRFRFLAAPSIEHREKSTTRNPAASRIYFRDLLVYTRKYHGTAAWALMWLLSRPLTWGIALRWRFRPA